MSINEAGLSLIKEFEGLRLESYKCPAGVWTIGYGTTAGVSRGMSVTKEDAERLLRADTARFEIAVCALRRPFTSNQFSALVSFAYNCGSANLRRLCLGRTNAEIADALLLYNKADGKVLAGLTRRREAERKLFLKQD
jgi:lysozyme